MKKTLLKVWNENKGFILFIALMLIFRSAFADFNHVPTGSMKPTILEGDRIVVNKMAYDIRVPFTHISLYKRSDPKRGDIIIFDSKVSKKRLVKRVVGIPGDTIELKNNVLFINGEKLAYEDISSNSYTQDKSENLMGIEHFVRVKKYGSQLSTFAPVVVPEDSYLALGDNRDNSADSRVIGFVPRNEIVGRSKSVILSFNYDNYYLPRADRFFHTL
ncbi:signal peptidase I [Agarilytica rhodophyticola]|uniref:signal peptidase I n=1 Tax=Agarilytica rhodophyticola TaxID=1737490 RepID=UPI000B3458BD|nr:signal peptidase I [Agarilytica rhodophyticola]